MFSGNGNQWVVVLVINKQPLLNWFQNTLGARGCPVTLLTRIPKTICPPEHVPLAETHTAFLTQETQPEEEQREKREEGGEIMPVQISFSLTNDFHLHNHYSSPRDTVSSLKDYNHFLTGFMAYVLAPIQSILHIAPSGAVHRQSHCIAASVARQCL